MKRNNKEQQQQERALCSLPPEILSYIALFVKEGCEKLQDYLYFHASCRCLWYEYCAIGDAKLIDWCVEKSTRNHALLSKTSHRQYKSNLVDWTFFECIIRGYVKIKETIKEEFSLENLADTLLNEDRKSSYQINDWLNFKGIQLQEFFSDEPENEVYENLCPSGEIIMNALAVRVFLRLDFTLYLALPEEIESQSDIKTLIYTDIYFPLTPLSTKKDFDGALLYIR